MANKKILEFIRKYTISASALISISANLHEKKKLGFFSSKKEKLSF